MRVAKVISRSTGEIASQQRLAMTQGYSASLLTFLPIYQPKEATQVPDNRPEYDNYKRPSILTCFVRLIIAFAFVGLVYAFFFLVYPDLRAWMTYPIIAISLLLLVGFGIYYLVTDRRRKAEHARQYEAQQAQRAKSDDWVAKELADSPYQATDAAPEDPNGQSNA